MILFKNYPNIFRTLAACHNCNVIFLFFMSRSYIYLITDNRIRFMLDPRSISVLPTSMFPIVTGNITLPESFSFCRRVLWITTLELTSNWMVYSSMYLLFFVRISFMNLESVSICSRALANRIFICNHLNISRNLSYCLYLRFLVGACR